jgi:hypothetical protein
MFANPDFAARTNQAFPLVGMLPQLPGEENFNPSTKEVARGRISRTQHLGLKTFAVAIKASRKDASIVEDEEIGGTQQVGEFTKLTVLECAALPPEMQQARRSAVRKRVLGNEFGRKVVMEIRDEQVRVII